MTIETSKNLFLLIFSVFKLTNFDNSVESEERELLLAIIAQSWLSFPIVGVFRSVYCQLGSDE
jgi:hypothetical protein